MYRKNVAGQNVGFAVISATTGLALTGATVTVKRMLDGAVQASGTGTVTEGGSGQYNYALSQADTNANQGSFLFTATGAIPVEKTLVFTACDPTVATNFGITSLPTTVVTTNASLLTSGTSTDQLSVSSGKVLLQPTQSGVTIPAVTVVGSVAGSVGSVAGGVTVTTNNDKTGYSLTVTPPTAVQVADAMLGRSIAGGSDGGRTVKDALRFLRNKWSIVGNILTVTTEDDVTEAWTSQLSTTVNAAPVTGSDPV
jgi:hypothetical protein